MSGADLDPRRDPATGPGAGTPTLPELETLLGILESARGAGPRVRSATLALLPGRHGRQLPLQAVALGTEKPEAPVLAIVGGIHGLERIGTHVVLAYLQSILERLSWSRSLQSRLETMRMLFIPIANPVGMLNGSRCNGRGVDLMRNAPVDSPHALRFFGGQRISGALPYYRGRGKDGLEPELRAIEAFLEREAFSSDSVILLDVHSGFGIIDRVWFPFAREPAPFPLLPETAALVRNFERAFPNHPYRFEPQATSYCTHGDFWDYMYDRFYARPEARGRIFLPLTLEMGSWVWVKKNPWQIFSFLGAFNPIKPHRRRRVLRRHLPLLDFLADSVESHPAWDALDSERRSSLYRESVARWYSGSRDAGRYLPAS